MVNERASSRVAGMAPPSKIWRWFLSESLEGRGFRPSREKRDEFAGSLSVSDTRPLRTGTSPCTCTGCLGRMYTRYDAGTSANSRLVGGALPAAVHTSGRGGRALVRRSASATQSWKKHTNSAWAERSSGSGAQVAEHVPVCSYTQVLAGAQPRSINGQLRRPRCTRINSKYRCSIR